MNDKLTAYMTRPFLVDADSFPRYVHRVFAHKACYTSREIDEARKVARANFQIFATHNSKPKVMPYEKASVQPIRTVKGKVAVIPIYGPVDQRLSSELIKAGGTPLEAVSASLDSLVNNPSIGAIVLRFDSPGGGVYGVEELSRKIYGMRERKPIYAISDSMAASAAYWIGSAASTFLATPGADTGSVGVFCMHVDESQAIADDGIKVTMVKAGRYKTELASVFPLSEEAKSNLQARADDIYDRFVSAVATNRGTGVDNVRANFGEGRVLGSKDALRVGMIDRIMTFDDLMDRLTGGSYTGNKAGMNKVEAETAVVN